MMTNPISDIRAIVGVSPQTLKVTSVRTKKICVQDILTGMKEKPTYYIPAYEPPKLLDLLKSSMIAVVHQDLHKEIEENEKESEKEEKISEIKRLLEEKAMQNMSAPIQTAFLPPEVNIPIATYEPYTGGAQQAPPNNPIISPISSIPSWIWQHFGGQGTPSPPASNPISQINPEHILSSMKYLSGNFLNMLNRVSLEMGKRFEELAHRVDLNRTIMVRENRYMIDAVSTFTTAMGKSLADYIRNIVVSIIENGCSYIPVGLAGVLDVRVINNSPFPQAIAFDNVVVKSMDYVLSKPRPFTVFAAPAETDTVHIPVTVENIDAVDYILDAKKKGAIPIVLSATVGVGPMKQTLTFAEGSVEVV